MSWEVAQKIADAVLYEGYLLYPYRASSSKNQVRWQFGVVAPRDFSEADRSENWEMQTECLVEADTAGPHGPTRDVAIDVRVRFLRLQRRALEAAGDPTGDAYRPVDRLESDGEQLLPWDEAVEEHLDIDRVQLSSLLAGPLEAALEMKTAEEVEPIRDATGTLIGRVIRTRWPIEGVVRITAEPAGELVRLWSSRTRRRFRRPR